MASPDPDTLSDRVRDGLERILASPDFEVTERNRRFLRYVVEETLEGRENRIKAYSIATCVFGRSAEFDPQIDPIVRIEARRLRRALEHYYLTGGVDDTVRITIPKGSYIATFEFPEIARSERAASGGEAAGTGGVRLCPPGPSIMVAPFDEEGASAAPGFARGFRRHLIVGLTRFTDLLVYGAETVQHADGERGAEGADRPVDVDFILEGSITVADGRILLETVLVDAHTGRFVWAESFDEEHHPAQWIALRDRVAASVVRTLAPPFGVIYSHRAKDIDGRPPDCLRAFEAVQLFYQYWRTFDNARFEEARRRLEEAVAREPDYAEAHACLSLLYTNASRFGLSLGKATFDPMERARRLAHRAVELAPRSSRSYHALGTVCWFSGDIEASFEALETGRVLNPHDTGILVELGSRHAVRCNWAQAVPLLQESYLRNPTQPSTYRMGFFLYHYMEGRHETALREVCRIEAPDIVYVPLVKLAVLARLGRMCEARATLGRLLAMHPGYPERAEADFRARSIHPEITAAVLGDLSAVIASAEKKVVNGLSAPAASR
ncbi:hypothetical protein LNKW23_32010 [Paralimibaculum aggregatum]|uniref:Adenylate cyclase n=1 Tax=Paralimibaculum aggregatum TaxID=3036245 RepID=A0ABQ6LLA3_9RHOB|nr:tetratricopeptide repeat protein [Limibaculum sp. NKW23]GMG83987.1 hypothetical protein LNKW23_32010 [Limibaculum sp. NKW23]